MSSDDRATVCALGYRYMLCLNISAVEYSGFLWLHSHYKPLRFAHVESQLLCHMARSQMILWQQCFNKFINSFMNIWRCLKSARSKNPHCKVTLQSCIHQQPHSSIQEPTHYTVMFWSKPHCFYLPQEKHGLLLCLLLMVRCWLKSHIFVFYSVYTKSCTQTLLYKSVSCCWSGFSGACS